MPGSRRVLRRCVRDALSTPAGWFAARVNTAWQEVVRRSLRPWLNPSPLKSCIGFSVAGSSYPVQMQRCGFDPEGGTSASYALNSWRIFRCLPFLYYFLRLVIVVFQFYFYFVFFACVSFARAFNFIHSIFYIFTIGISCSIFSYFS